MAVFKTAQSQTGWKTVAVSWKRPGSEMSPIQPPYKVHKGLSCHTLPCSSSRTLESVMQTWGPGHSSARWELSSCSAGGIRRGSRAWHRQWQLHFPLNMPGVPHLVPSPRASLSPGQTEASQRICGAQLTTGVWTCSLEVPTHRDLHRPLLSTHERMERALRRETLHRSGIYLAHQRILKRPR